MKPKNSGSGRRIVCLVLVAVMLLGLISSALIIMVNAASSSEIKKELNGLRSQQAELKKEREALQAKIKENQSKTQTLVEKKSDIDQQISMTQASIDNLNEQVQQYSLLIANKQADLDGIRKKVDSGCAFLTTQMFFDNNILYNFLYRIREIGITVPVCAGIMPVTNGRQIARICQLSGTYLPARFKAVVDRFGDNPAAMKQAGIAYATDQIIDLIANGVNNIHVYSMNKPEVAAKIMENLGAIYESQL